MSHPRVPLGPGEPAPAYDTAGRERPWTRMRDVYFDLHVDHATREIVLRGEFTASTARCLATAVTAFQRKTGDFTIDLGGVTAIDEAGRSAVQHARSGQELRGARLLITDGDILSHLGQNAPG